MNRKRRNSDHYGTYYSWWRNQAIQHEENNSPEDWDIKSGRAVNKSGKSTSAKISKLNKELDDLRGQISIQYTRQLNNNGYVEPEKLRNNVLGIEEKQHSLLTYFTEHNLQYKDKVGTTATQRPIHVTN